MKRYMVVFKIDGEQGCKFTDDICEADQIKMNVECGVGGYAEVYEYIWPCLENDYECGYQMLYC